MARKAWQPILDRAAEIVAEYASAVTLRQLHYRLVAEAAATGSGYRNVKADYSKLSELTAQLRRQDGFPALLDRTRGIEAVETFAGPRDALDRLAGWYRLDVLAGHETLPIIVVEKATLLAQVSEWYGDLCIPAVALRGYASESP